MSEITLDPRTDSEKRESELIDLAMAAIMATCQELGLKPSPTKEIEFGLILIGVIRMIGEAQITALRGLQGGINAQDSAIVILESRLAALEGREHIHPSGFAALRTAPTVPSGQAPNGEGFKP